MQFSPLEPADAGTLDEVVTLWRSAYEADRPADPPYCPAWEQSGVLHPQPGERYEHWLARDGGRLTGVVALGFPELDNTGTAYVDVVVHPAVRGRGTGRALWDLACARARRQDRKLAMFEARMDTPDEAFARAVGGELGILSARRRLVVGPAVLATCDALWDAALPHAAGYEIHTYAGAVPERWVADMAYLAGRMSTDAPLDDLEFEPEAYDVARMRDREAVRDARGADGYSAVAVHAGSGAVVAFTDVGYAAEDPATAYQHDTLVDPAHRGHRLGTLVKVANLRQVLAARPTIERLFTWNAVSNGPMIAVNEAMGFRLWDLWGEWQARL